MSSSRYSRNLPWPGFALLLAFGLMARPALGQDSPATNQPNLNPPSPRKPCVFLIVADDLGWGDLGCYGQTKIKTPNLDALAAEGMRFTSFYAGSSLSAPSRTALMTGRDTGHTPNRGIPTFPVPADQPLLPEVLQTSHYITGAAGKWSLSGATPPGHRGFDEWAGFLDDISAQAYYPAAISRTRLNLLDGKFDHEDAVPGTMLWDNQNGRKGRYVNDLFASAATNFLKDYKPSSYNSYRATFLYLAPTIPFSSPEDSRPTAAGASVPSEEPYATNVAWLPVERTRAAMISRLDTYVGILTNCLSALGYDRNTVIIFTSATGPQHDAEIDPSFFHSAGPFRGFKHDLYEGAIRVPLIVRWPIQTRPGAVCDLPCAAWDLLPTLAEAARAQAPTNLDGISLLPTLQGKPQTNTHEFLDLGTPRPRFQTGAPHGKLEGRPRGRGRAVGTL